MTKLPRTSKTCRAAIHGPTLVESVIDMFREAGLVPFVEPLEEAKNRLYDIIFAYPASQNRDTILGILRPSAPGGPDNGARATPDSSPDSAGAAAAPRATRAGARSQTGAPATA